MFSMIYDSVKHNNSAQIGKLQSNLISVRVRVPIMFEQIPTFIIAPVTDVQFFPFEFLQYHSHLLATQSAHRNQLSEQLIIYHLDIL